MKELEMGVNEWKWKGGKGGKWKRNGRKGMKMKEKREEMDENEKKWYDVEGEMS